MRSRYVIIIGGGTFFVIITSIALLLFGSNFSGSSSIVETNKSSTITTIMIPAGTIANSTNYQPQIARVVIGINNTVKWINESNHSNGVWADNDMADPSFTAATNSNSILPRGSFEFTFTKPGIINYHGNEWLSGTVLVLANNSVSNNSQISYNVQPKIKSYNSYDGIEKNEGIVALNNQTYYQITLNGTINNITKEKNIEFHGVNFSFPYGIGNGPGGSTIIPDVKFQDGSEEIYGKTVRFTNGSSYGMGLPIPAGPISTSTKMITLLSNHMHPQAGITIYENKIKLLVSTN